MSNGHAPLSVNGSVEMADCAGYHANMVVEYDINQILFDVDNLKRRVRIPSIALKRADR